MEFTPKPMTDDQWRYWEQEEEVDRKCAERAAKLTYQAERFQDMFVAMAGLGGHFWTEHLSGASAPTRPRRAAA